MKWSDRLDCVAISKHALSVIPRANDQGNPSARALTFDRTKNVQRPIQIVRIIPATHRQDRRTDVAQVRKDIPRFPIGVVCAMIHYFRPAGRMAVQKFCINIRERTQVQKKFVCVRRMDIELAAAAHYEGERSVMMTIVSDEPIRLRRWWRHRLQRWVA